MRQQIRALSKELNRLLREQRDRLERIGGTGDSTREPLSLNREGDFHVSDGVSNELVSTG
jgi:hypothetical protein